MTNVELINVLQSSQALSQEFALEAFVSKLMRIVFENTHAQKVYLITLKKKRWQICAEGCNINDNVTVRRWIERDKPQLPVTLIDHIAHTHSHLCLEDASHEGMFVSDPYILETQPKSICSIPLQNQDELLGILYLENNQAIHAFDATQVTILNLLAPQIAISFQNVLQRAYLEQTVFQKTSELAGANQLLRTSNSDLDAFAHTVAHSLKNPLALIMGYSEFLLETPSLDEVLNNAPVDTPSSTFKDSLVYIEQAGRRAVNIIDELLLLAGVHKGRIELEPVNMNEVLNHVQQRLEYMLKQYNGVLIYPEHWPVAVAYGPWLEEVWTNYITNGLKYGGRPPHLELGSTCLDNGTIQFWVKDNGAGLSESEQAALFTEFTRLDEVKAEGHGLGLSIVRRIVERMGGEVGVESEVGAGCSFYFTLQAAD